MSTRRLSRQPPDDRPLLTLLSLATQCERERLVTRLSALGFADIALPGARLLASLAAGPRSIAGLAEATATTKQYTAREVAKLALARYISVGPSTEDRRERQVYLTARGRELLAASRKLKRTLDARIRRQLGTANTALLRKLLRLLIEG